MLHPSQTQKADRDPGTLRRLLLFGLFSMVSAMAVLTLLVALFRMASQSPKRLAARPAASELPKASFTPTATATFTSTSTATPTNTPTPIPTNTSTSTPTDTPTNTPTSTSFYTPTPVPPTWTPMATADPSRWIDVNVTNQTVTAYDHDVAVATFIVSTGKVLTPTITGQFKIYRKFPVADMYGPDFYLPNIPYVMYFYKGFALHGTYWHNNFGEPSSRGCVNFTIPDAEWLFNFASIGTVVNVH